LALSVLPRIAAFIMFATTAAQPRYRCVTRAPTRENPRNGGRRSIALPSITAQRRQAFAAAARIEEGQW